MTVATDEAEHAFRIYVADSPQERRQGLMFVESLPRDVGMLFLFDGNDEITMWMKNTLIPLDMLFVRRNGVIANIAARTTPRSEKVIRSDGPVCCVLELRGGTAEALGIEPGDRVIHPFFVP